MVTHGLNLPRHGAETAYFSVGVPSQGCQPNSQTVVQRRTMQPREVMSDSCIAGRVRLRDKSVEKRNICRSFAFLEKASVCKEERVYALAGDPGKSLCRLHLTIW